MKVHYVILNNVKHAVNSDNPRQTRCGLNAEQSTGGGVCDASILRCTGCLGALTNDNKWFGKDLLPKPKRGRR